VVYDVVGWGARYIILLDWVDDERGWVWCGLVFFEFCGPSSYFSCIYCTV